MNRQVDNLQDNLRNNLQSSRQGWAEVKEFEYELLRALSPVESLRQFLDLQREFSPHLQKTARLFHENRNQALYSWHKRLQTINRIRINRMNTLISSLDQLQTLLEQAGIPSMVIGGLAVSIWGEPRLTRGVDVKIMLHRDEHEQLLELLPEDYVPLNADPVDAFQRHGIAFFQDPSQIRIDMMLADTWFDETAIGRAQTIEEEGHMIRVCTAEDLVIYKIVSLRPRDQSDLETIILRQQDKLDDAYVEEWLIQFEQALDDSTLIDTYRRIRRI